MENLLQEYRNFIVSLLFALVSVGLFLQSAIFSSMTVSRLELQTAANILQKEAKEIEERKKSASDIKKEQDAGIRSIPEFLKRINQLAKANNVIIRKLAPSQESAIIFDIDIITDFFTFLRFSAELESLDTVIMAIEVHPYDPSKVPPLHTITFSITPRNDAAPLTGQRIQDLKDKVAKVGRNPLQRKVGNDRPEIDLTWIYKLGGIGTSQDGRVYCTIDRQNYFVGQQLEGRTITAIESDRIFMTLGQEKFILKFRKKE